MAFNTIIGSGIGYKDEDEDPDVGGERDKVDAAKSRSSIILFIWTFLIIKIYMSTIFVIR